MWKANHARLPCSAGADGTAGLVPAVREPQDAPSGADPGSGGRSFSVNSGDIIHPPCSERRSAKIAGDHVPCDWGVRCWFP